jgi:hypothetical protein
VWDKIISEDVWNKALDVLELYRMHVSCFNTICYDLKQPHIVRFDTCPGFDTQREPVVGTMVSVDVNAGKIIKEKLNNQIYHHHWLWVTDDYQGFDVQASYEWSKRWLSKLSEVASGRAYLWEEQLRKYNLE